MNKFKKSATVLSVLVGTLLLTGTSLAGTNIFLKLDGIQGESTDSQHLNEINLLAYSQNVSNGAQINMGGGGGGAKPVCGAVTVVKRVDRASPALIGDVLTARTIKTGIISFVTAGNQAQSTYSVTLSNIYVTSVVQSDSSGADVVTENVTLAPQTLLFNYRQIMPNGLLGTPQTFGYDCMSNKVM